MVEGGDCGFSDETLCDLEQVVEELASVLIDGEVVADLNQRIQRPIVLPISIISWNNIFLAAICR
jgi:hypothetical protein